MGCAPAKRGDNKAITMAEKNDKKQKSKYTEI